MIFKETITYDKDTLERVNALLNIESLEVEEYTEEQKLLNPKTDDFIGLMWIDFENGNSITIDVCSGSYCYYDNCVLKDKDGYEITCFDCNYSIDNEMEFNYEDDTYIITVVAE